MSQQRSTAVLGDGDWIRRSLNLLLRVLAGGTQPWEVGPMGHLLVTPPKLSDDAHAGTATVPPGQAVTCTLLAAKSSGLLVRGGNGETEEGPFPNCLPQGTQPAKSHQGRAGQCPPLWPQSIPNKLKAASATNEQAAATWTNFRRLR